MQTCLHNVIKVRLKPPGRGGFNRLSRLPFPFLSLRGGSDLLHTLKLYIYAMIKLSMKFGESSATAI